MKKLIIIILVLFGCTSNEPLTYERFDAACKTLCKDLYKSDGTVVRVSNAGVNCYCGDQK